jgi:hypothetical protein
VTTTNAQCRVAGRLMVALPRDHAFRLFTPRGEQGWAPQWKPHFPAGAVDDTAPGTVFETHAHGQTSTWVVVDSTSGRRIRYARVTPQVDAGTVTVTLDDVNGQSEVTVTYELTTLTDAANAHLDAFAAQYPAFLQSWEQDIAASLSQRREL